MASSYNPDLMDRMFDMDPDLLHLLTHEITAFAQWDVLRYFLESGHAQASMDDISIAVGRDSEALIDMLGQLTTRGWLARRHANFTCWRRRPLASRRWRAISRPWRGPMR